MEAGREEKERRREQGGEEENTKAVCQASSPVTDTELLV